MQILTYSLFYARSTGSTPGRLGRLGRLKAFFFIFFLYLRMRKHIKKQALNDPNDPLKKLHVERAFFCTFTSPRQSWSEAPR